MSINAAACLHANVLACIVSFFLCWTNYVYLFKQQQHILHAYGSVSVYWQ